MTGKPNRAPRIVIALLVAFTFEVASINAAHHDAWFPAIVLLVVFILCLFAALFVWHEQS